MAVHIPLDKVAGRDALAALARAGGITIGAVNANVFQDDDYMLGSVCNPDQKVRKKALSHLLEFVDIMDATGSRDLKPRFVDGTSYIVGGGSRNELLCQLSVDDCGLPVVAGPAEATALGNVLVQARALGAAPGTLDGMRALLRTCLGLRRYAPSDSTRRWEEAASRLG